MTKEEAEVILKVNTEDSRKKFEELEKKAAELRAKFADAYKKGDTRGIKEVNDELQKVNREMDRMRTNAANIKAAMKKLDESSPRELQRTIKFINSELGSGRVKRGTKEWEYYTSQLKAARAELKRVNDQMQETEGFFSRMNRKVNDWGTSLAAGIAAFAGVTMAGKAAVQSYADMEAEEANVRKYTGMTAEEVRKLNDEFKEMDTRTAREELNRLAQEAGRLGKTSIEDVLGFVRASDQIGVALDELGDGATLELSKLTNIFGDEKLLGTEKALLSVGSVVNELSQNCTAGASYLVDYAQRMAGVGAQAKMTIPQIMSYAAVLDSQGQNVEAAATAMSQLIMKMYQDPAKIAKAAGMDVKEFSDILKKDANEALIMLLKTLNSYGGINVLATIFDDMGTDGARASAAIAALAGNVDMLVWEQGEANKAFREATSVTKEYEVQNNTVQAQLDKARKKFTELAVDLGEKLLPVMKYCISGTSMLMRVLNVLIDFYTEHRKEIVTTAAAVAAYNLIISTYIARVTLASKWTTIWTTAQSNFRSVAAVFRLGVVAAHNAVQYFTNGLQVNYDMQQRWRGAMSAMKFSSWTGLVLAAASAIYLFATRTKEATTAQERLQKIRDKAQESVTGEMNRLKQLVRVAEDETLSLEQRKKAIEELNAVIPDYNAKLDETSGKYQANKKALDEYIRSLVRLYEIEGAKEQLQTLGKEKSNLTVSLNKAQKNYESAKANGNNGYTYTTSAGTVGNTAFDSRRFFAGQIEDLEKNIAEIVKREQEIIDAYGADVLIEKKVAVETTFESNTPEIKGTLGESEKDRKEREKAEREARKRKREEEAEARRILKEHLEEVKAERLKEEAVNLASYTSGQQNYLEFTEAKAKIEEKYIDDSLKVLEEHGKKDSEAYAKLLKEREDHTLKSAERLRKASLFDIEQDHKVNEDAAVRAFYDTGSPVFQNQKALNQALLAEDLRYLKEKMKLYSEGSEEWIKINSQLQERISKDQLDKQRETAQAFLSFETEYRRSSGSRREKMELEMLGELHRQGLISEKEYQDAVRKIKQKYRDEDIEKAREVQNEYADLVLELYRSFTDLFNNLSVSGEDFWENLANAAAASFAVMGALLSQFSAYSNAERDLEVAKIEKRYDSEIKAAGSNTKKVQQLEEQKEKEIAKTKTKYNDRAMKLEIAQAIAQTATNALGAYGAMVKIPVVGPALAAAAAAMATAAGMIQVAVIRKQHQAEAAGYFSGGFTKRDPDDRKEVGVVHANEFVANHHTVASPVLSPILNLIDHAQRTNTVGSITAEDVSNAIGRTPGVSPRGGSGAPSSDGDKAIAESIASLSVVSAENRAAIKELSRQIEEGIEAFVVMDGTNGLHNQYVRYKKLLNNSKR